MHLSHLHVKPSMHNLVHGGQLRLPPVAMHFPFTQIEPVRQVIAAQELSLAPKALKAKFLY